MPSTQASVLFTGTPNTPVLILNESLSGDGFTWYQVRLGNGTEGWVRGDLVSVTSGSTGASAEVQNVSRTPALPQTANIPQTANMQRGVTETPVYDPSSGALMRPGSSAPSALPNVLPNVPPNLPPNLPASGNGAIANFPNRGPSNGLPAPNPTTQNPAPLSTPPPVPRYQPPTFPREVVVDQQGQRDLAPNPATAPSPNPALPTANSQPGLVDRFLEGTGAILNAVGNRVENIIRPGPAPLVVTQADQDYFMEVAMGSEWGNNAALIRKWNTDLRVRVTGTRTAEDDATISRVMQELNELLDGSGVQLRRDDRNPNVQIIYAPETQFRQLEPNYVPGNLGFFWVQWNSSVINNARILITNTNRVTQRERSHLLREELTQVLGLMRDSNRYPNSIFYQGWTDVTEYAEIDRTLIRMLYHSQLQPGMTRSQVVAALQTLADSPQAARIR
ncbi:MAG: hypothetical protein Fur0046_02440 [Cyanobacteria bacterium J069]